MHASILKPSSDIRATDAVYIEVLRNSNDHEVSNMVSEPRGRGSEAKAKCSEQA